MGNENAEIMHETAEKPERIGESVEKTTCTNRAKRVQ